VLQSRSVVEVQGETLRFPQLRTRAGNDQSGLTCTSLVRTLLETTTESCAKDEEGHQRGFPSGGRWCAKRNGPNLSLPIIFKPVRF